MKKLFYSVLIVAAAMTTLSTVSSCEDMLEPNTDMVMFPEDNQLNTANDTMSSVIGVVGMMQKVADRTLLLGMVRSDLIKATEAASQDIKELANFSVSENNVYNRPQDYYRIINSCNYFIEHADINYKKQGVSVFEKDLAAMHAFRAWAYLQLCLNYGGEGSIPFYTDFIGTQVEAEKVLQEAWTSKQEIYDWLIDDLEPFQDARPFNAGEIDKMRSQYFAIPVRVMLAELSLWAGHYEDAAWYYHDYFDNTDRPHPLYCYSASFSETRKPQELVEDPYWSSSYLRENFDYDAFIPMHTDATLGEISHMYEIMNSTANNNYYYQLTVSDRAKEISRKQSYCYVFIDGVKRDTIYMKDYPFKWPYEDYNGDLRLSTVYNISSLKSSTSNYSDTEQTVRYYSKESSKQVPLYRREVLYLHYAEALNRAGYPTVAFAVLKFGLCDDNYARMDSTDINFDEVAAAGELVQFDPLYFSNKDTDSDGRRSSSGIQGIHSRGCGDAAANKEYVIPALATANDTMLWVEDAIMEEIALETPVENVRFYDLMRVALRRQDNSYLASRIAVRNGEKQEDAALKTLLMDARNWYLPMKK